VSYPALDSFAADHRIRRSTFRLYMHLQRSVLHHAEPREVRIWYLKDRLHMGATAIISGLNWLVLNGYLIEHGRGQRMVRSFTLAWSVLEDHSRNRSGSAA
jgi:hypothetical protein